MPHHRFYDELSNLENNPPSGKYDTLIIGTFNAADQSNLDNEAEWFYGRKKNEFWYLYPQMRGNRSLHTRENPNLSSIELANIWKNYCHETSTIIIDLYKYIGNNLTNHADESIKNPEDFIPFNYKMAFNEVSFKNVLFTWKSTDLSSTLGLLKAEFDQWFKSKGARTMHMLTPSYAFPKSKEYKLTSWINSYNSQ